MNEKPRAIDILVTLPSDELSSKAKSQFACVAVEVSSVALGRCRLQMMLILERRSKNPLSAQPVQPSCPKAMKGEFKTVKKKEIEKCKDP